MDEIPTNYCTQDSTNPAPPRALLLDYGGVLMRTRTPAKRNAWDERLGLPAGSVERVVHGSAAWRQCQLGTLSEADYWQAVAMQLSLASDELPQFRRDYFAEDELDQEAIALLRNLHAQGTPIALLSNESRSLPARLAHLGIADLFSPLLVSSYLGCMKPDPEAFQAALALMGSAPAEVLFIDDLAENVAAATSLGLGAIQFRAGMSLSELLVERFSQRD